VKIKQPFIKMKQPLVRMKGCFVRALSDRDVERRDDIGTKPPFEKKSLHLQT
jgi:hypothetical protein